jgi:hypothetical protein
MVRIKDFAESHNVGDKAVSRWMKLHHIEYDREKGLTEEQISLLEKQYPLPQPIQIVEDIETKNKLVEAQNALILTQQALISAQAKINTLESEKLLLESNSEKEISGLKQEISSFKKTWFGLYKKDKKRPQV